MPGSRVIFITGTDTGVGKTITTLCLGVLFKAQGHDVGVMKPVQCAGSDTLFLKKALGIDDEARLMNPFYALRPLSPHLALRYAKIRFDPRRIKHCLRALRKRHDIVLVEGAGGLMAPITARYFMADLIRDLRPEVIIVARLGLGTINHTLLTIYQARAWRLVLKGIIFCKTTPGPLSLAERTNPGEIEKLSGVKVLGTIPYLKSFKPKDILLKCAKFKPHC